MPDAEIAVRFVKHLRSVGLALRVGLAPVHPEFLARIADDLRDTDPDGGGSVGGVPLVDFIR